MKEPAMIREILEQPAVLERTAAAVGSFPAVDPLRPAPGGTVLLVGCGDMHFSACAAAALFRAAFPRASFRVEALDSMSMRWRAAGIREGDTVLAASFSGRTPRTVEAALLARKAGGRVLGITGNASSPLAERLAGVLVIPAGPPGELDKHPYGGYHANVPQTKTFTAILFAELLLLARLAEEAGLGEGEGRLGGAARWAAALGGIPAFLESLLPALRRDVDAFVSTSFAGRREVVVLGSGPWRPAAMYGAAKLLETAVPSRHQCIEEFNHLELFVTGEESLVVFLCPDEPSRQRAGELAGPYRRLGCGRLILSAEPGASPGRSAGEEGAPGGAPGGGGREGGEKTGNHEEEVRRILLPPGPDPLLFFGFAAALQFLAAAAGLALSRDIDRWVGGVRTKLIEDLSLETIRGSKIIGA